MTNRLIGAVVAASMVGVPLTMTAEDSADSVKVTPTTVRALPTVEVAGNRADRQTPVAFTNVGRRELERSNDGRDLPYLLQMTPSIVVTGDAGGGIGYSYIRVRGTDASRINVTANGIPINDSENHRVYWVNMPDLVSSLRDVQIQRGAGTSTNGAGAFGASINMATELPSLDPAGEVSLSYGSFNSNKQTISVNTGETVGGWSADLRLSHIGSDGYIDRAFSHLWSYFGQIACNFGAANLRLLAFGGKEQTYMAWDYPSKEDMEKYGRRYNPSGRYIDAEGTPAFYPDQTDNFTQHHLQLLLNQRLSSSIRLSAALHYTKGDGYYRQYRTSRLLREYGLAPYLMPDGLTTDRSDLITLKYNDNDFGGATLNASYSSPRLNVAVGAAANYFRGIHYGEVAWVRNYIGPVDPLQRFYDNTGRKLDANIFGRADWRPSSPLSLYADLQLRFIRYTIRGTDDTFNPATNAMADVDISRRYTFFNPKAGATYNSGPHRMFASWSVARKEPVRDNFLDGDPRRLPSAETLFDYEVGYSFSRPVTAAGVTLYFMDYHDQLVPTGRLSDTGNPLSENVPRSYRAGIELQARLSPVPGVDWTVTSTFSRSRIKDFVEYIYRDEWTDPIAIPRGTTPIAFSPDITAASSLRLSFIHKAEATIATRFVGSQYMDNARADFARLPSYCVTDISLSYIVPRFIHLREARLTLAFYNIFNKMYCNNGYAGAGYTLSPDGQPEIYRYAGYAAQAGFNFMSTLSIKF